MIEILKQILAASLAGKVRQLVTIDSATTISIDGLAGRFALDRGIITITFDGTPPHVTKTMLGILRAGVNLAAIEITAETVQAVGSNGKRYQLTEI